jgi:hypothetical protein
MITAYGDAETKRQAVERGAEVLGRSVAKSICALSAHNLAQFAAVHESALSRCSAYAFLQNGTERRCFTSNS